MKPRLLIIELWGLGDLAIATPFIRAAARHYDVTLLAKPYAQELRQRFWPEIEVVPFDAPWTVFQGKYQLWRWPWAALARLRERLADRAFAAGVSSRWDPRDHLVLRLAGVRQRLGFPRLGSNYLLTDPLPLPGPTAERYENWRMAGARLGLELPRREALPMPARATNGLIVLHTGARLPARVWPLENYRELLGKIRADGWSVKLLANPEQGDWWRQAGENPVVPRTIPELLAEMENCEVFIGNCSGPGHLAAILGLPTFTLFGPSMPEWFLPLHPRAEYIEGPACPFRPCADYCHFSAPACLTGLAPEPVWSRVQSFLRRNVPRPVVAA